MELILQIRIFLSDKKGYKMAGFWYLLIDSVEWMNFFERMGKPVNDIYTDALIYDGLKHEITMNGERLF